MFAAVLHAARDLRLEQREPTPLAANEVRVRLGAGGICGSDLHYFLHGRTGAFEVVEPLVLGHELAGWVEAVGGDVAGLAPGTPVAINPARPCGACPRCREGRTNLCADGFFMGSASRRPHMQGGFATAVTVRADQCHPVPAAIPIEEAALAEPLAVCLHAADRAGDLPGRKVLVLGCGPIGLLAIAAARLRGAAGVAASDIVPEALARAAAPGADRLLAPEAIPEASVDVVIEASGATAAVATALAAVRRGGTIVQVGNLPGAPFPVPLNSVMAKEIALMGSFRLPMPAFAEAVALIAGRRVPVGAIITARLPLAEAREAFELAADRRRSAKVILTGERGVSGA